MIKQEFKNANDQSRDYDFSEIEDDPRFLIIQKEVKFAYILWIAFAVIALGVIYVLGSGDPTEYSYVMGLPLWFFAYLMVVVAFIILIAYVVRNKFQDMDLD